MSYVNYDQYLTDNHLFLKMQIYTQIKASAGIAVKSHLHIGKEIVPGSMTEV